MNRKAGTRVYLLLEHEVTHEEKRRYGTLEADEGLWDYSNVRFDDAPGFVQPVLCYYLFSDEDQPQTGV